MRLKTMQVVTLPWKQEKDGAELFLPPKIMLPAMKLCLLARIFPFVGYVTGDSLPQSAD